MTGLERTLLFLKGSATDHPPFHPIIMRWAARHAGVKYGRFCTDPLSKCMAMTKAARDFGIDWVTVMSDPWAEASAFGIEVDYPVDSLPVPKGGFPDSALSASRLKKYNPLKSERCRNRLIEIGEYRKMSGDSYFITGWVEGAVAEYVDLRGATNASIDFLTDPESVARTLDLIVECAMEFITLQISAGAHCIGIGDAFCSQIGPDLFMDIAIRHEKRLVDHIHAEGAIAKLHICGDTSAILPAMISTGADIIDVDHLVPSMNKFTGLLRPGQVFSGKSDPVTVIQNGSPELIEKSVYHDFIDASGRCIVSAGCEITPETSDENMTAFRRSAEMITKR